MLKNSLFILVMAFFLAACGGADTTKTDEKAGDTGKTEMKKGLTDGTYNLAADSKVDWKGSAVTKSHTGTINVSTGSFMVKDGALVSGSFDLDMTSITVTDLEGEKKGNLEGHLKNEDFFESGTHPTASFKITSVMPVKVEGATHKIKGDLTIKGKTNPVEFNAMVSEDAGAIMTKATLEFDRSKWGIEYKSPSSSAFTNLAKDKLINDNIEISFNLKGMK